MSIPGLQMKIIFLSTYPPKKCGIASFTEDLIKAINKEIAKSFVIEVCALDKKKNRFLYEAPVMRVLDGYDSESLVKTAKKINNDPDIQLVCIEHEFGLYGGGSGEYLLGFLSMLEKPFIIRFHTVLPNPSEKMLRVVQAISLLTSKIIVMTRNSVNVLVKDYGLNADSIIIIPHGTHPHSTINTDELKLKYNLENKQVFSTFGLLSPNKGVEKGILAMKEISAVFPDAVYLVLGQTHPNLLEQEGEKYRNYLLELIEENDLHENVRLINEYLPTKCLMEYLALTDIYLFTSKDPNQAVSGTFLYAMSSGCPIISNSFVLAKEMLDDETGIILTTGSESELAENAIHILRNPELKKKMGSNAFKKTRNTTWEKVGEKHASLFYGVLQGQVFTGESLNLFTN